MATNDDKNYRWQDWSQQHRSAYDPNYNAHRMFPVNVDYNQVNYTYNGNGSLASIEYLYDSECEVTTILTSADVASSLDGKSFSVFSGKDALEYRIWYTVGIGTPPPADTPTVKYIQVNLLPNDLAPVVALATKNAISSHITGSVDLEASTLSSTLQITAQLKGETTDSSDIDTGFTISTETQGLTETVDIVNFTYDANGNVTEITSDSGENIILEPSKNIRNINYLRDNISIKDSDGHELDIQPDGSIGTSQATTTTHEVDNLAMAVSGTEYDYTFPANTKKIQLKSREKGVIKFSYTSGQSGINYMTILPGERYELTELNTTSTLTVYLQSTKDSDTLEILYVI